jgi:DNA repair exonuclease SbcCD nuclease subunit
VKVLSYSDLHIRPKRLEDCVTVLKAIPLIYKTYGCELVINGGDTFDTRGIIETNCLQAIYNEYKSWSEQGIQQISLVGNHDQEDRDGEIHPMSIFSFPKWKTVDKPIMLYGMWFFPYMKNEKIEKFFYKKDINDFKDKLAFVHWGFTGAYMNDWRKDPSGVPTKYVENFKKVFAGHYHYRAPLDGYEKVQYIGSPMQQTFAELGQDKGVLVIDTETGEHEFVEIKNTSKHYKLEVEWSEKGRRTIKGDKKVITERDFVEYVIRGDAEKVGSIKREALEKIVPCKNLKMTREVKEKSYSRLNLETKEVHDTGSIMQKYVEFVETGLDKKKLLDIGQEIINA